MMPPLSHGFDIVKENGNDHIIKLLTAKARHASILTNFKYNDEIMHRYLADSKTKVLVGRLDGFGSNHLALAMKVNHPAYLNLLARGSENLVVHQRLIVPLIEHIEVKGGPPVTTLIMPNQNKDKVLCLTNFHRNLFA